MKYNCFVQTILYDLTVAMGWMQATCCASLPYDYE